ncbi:hypothetical protein H6G81_28045 [Scytonema hofmannii FACHB-248]|uniref:DUF3592 domain-containing protein n=1 Tax=Scytonema hofmannii FACHB-248 TaxID=1842502 RepID=A0ABR8GYN1_9CYAN|nr:MULTISPECIES: hypothetical protein [Nostocales]MBD2608262.1 hypothetical protein [Scytonema hofmannii FACHB-248]
MPEPLTILASIALGALLTMGIVGAIAIVVYIIVKVIDLIKWFRDKKKERISGEQKNLIHGSVGARIKDGKVKEIDCNLFNEKEEEYQMVQFTYDREKDEIVDLRAVTAKYVDSELEEAHRGGETVVYTNV